MRRHISLGLIAVLLLSTGLALAAGAELVRNSSGVPAGSDVVEFPEDALEVAPGVFYLGKAIDNGKVVDGYAFVHYANGDVPDVSGLESSTCYGFVFGSDVAWEWSEPYLINPANDRGLSSDGILEKFEDSISTWENEITVDVIGDGAITDEKINWRKLDGINMVRFGNLPSTAIAMNILWWNSVDRNLVEWDQVFDDRDFDWSLDCNAEDCTSKMDFQNIATHELGHAFGLGDLYTSDCIDQTMYGYSSFAETKKRTLEDGDIVGITTLYEGA